MKEIIKPIKDFDDYYVSNYGKVYSLKTGTLKEIAQWFDGKKNYKMVALTRNDRVRCKLLVHRLVAITFIDNPNNLPEVDHLDKNKTNNFVTNLCWCTRKDNLNHSYSTKSPSRNTNLCELYFDDVLLGKFESISKACRYAKKHYNASETSLSKYLSWGNLTIKSQTHKRIIKRHKNTQNKNPIRLYKNGYFVKEFKKYSEVANYIEKELGITVKPKTIAYYCNKNNNFYGYSLIKRKSQ